MPGRLALPANANSSQKTNNGTIGRREEMERPRIVGIRFREVTVAIVLLLLIVASSALASQQVRVEYEFDRPEISEIRIESDVYSRIAMAGCPNAGKVGEPALPARGAQILLPYGTEVESIEIVAGEAIVLGDGFYVEPNAEQAKLTSAPVEPVPPVPDPGIYGSDQPFPEARFEKVGVQSFRGYRMLILKLQPVQYVPASGELQYYASLTVVVNTSEGSDASTMLRGLAEDEAEIITRVDNPETVTTYFGAGRPGSKSYDMLIITTPSLSTAFQQLKDYHDSTGILTEIHTTADVGSSTPDDIRAYIRDVYLNDGIEYVIIGADDDIIPAKDLYVEMSPGGEAEYNMPADLYFSCLDGTYNYDGDSRWGEPTDGPGGGDVDLVAEVHVGRAAVGTLAEALRFVDKTLEYVAETGPYLQDVLLVGEYLGFGGDADYAKNYMNELIDGSSMHGYTTVGIPYRYSISRRCTRPMATGRSQISRIRSMAAFIFSTIWVMATRTMR